MGFVVTNLRLHHHRNLMPRGKRKYTAPEPDVVPEIPANKDERIVGQWYVSRTGIKGIWDGKTVRDYERQRKRACLKEQKRRLCPDYRRKQKEGWLYRTYGLTRETYYAMFEKQGYECGICKSDITPHTRLSHVDHCHKTGRVRGLLCHPCNLGLGFVEKDEGEFAKNCVTYLRCRA